ncbi:MAG: DUF2341 domain-containing protein [Actinomycetota bacterium]
MGSQEHQRDEVRRPSRRAAGFAVFVAIILLPQIAFAAINIGNHMEAEINGFTTGAQFFAYDQGDEAAYDLEADFDLGAYVDTEVDLAGTQLQLATASTAGWWHVDWGARRCFDVVNGGDALDEHQVRLDFDSSADMLAGLLQPLGEDYRAIADDDTTELDFFVEEGVGTANTIIWVQLDLAAFATTSFCLYFDNPTALSESSEAETFTYEDGQREVYFPAWRRFDGSAGNDGTLDVVSYVDDNDVTVGGLTVNLDAGDLFVFTGVTPDTQILTDGPIGGRGRGQGMDALVPATFAGTDMVFPTNRSNNAWTLVSPTDATATVEIYDGTILRWAGSVGATAVTPVADIGGGRSGIIRSTNGVPVIVTHTATNNSFSDAQVVPPWFGDDLFGVRSRNLLIGFENAGSVDVWMDDGTVTTVVGTAGSSQSLNNGSDLDGNGTAVRITNMTGTSGGIQQADRDGYESTAFLPERLLDSEYWLPSQADYIAIACPTAMTINVGATPVPCTPLGPGFPGHAIVGGTPQGTRLASDNGEPFFAYYEDTRTQDETNLLGAKSAWAPALVNLTVTGTPTELLPAGPSVGTWTSPVIDTAATGSNVFGLLTADATLPVGTDVRMQVARGATPALALAATFVGPDGTPGTWFDEGANPIPYAWDFGDAFYVVRVELSTATPGTSPTVDLVSLGYDLPEVAMSSLHVVDTEGPVDDRDWVLRVWTQDPTVAATARLFYESSTGLTGASSASMDLDGVVQIVASGTTITQTSGPPVAVGPGLPHSVVVDTRDMTGVDLVANWEAQLTGTGILVVHELRISFI